MATEPVLVVLGAGGQLGRALADLAPPPGWRRLDLARGQAEITDRRAVAAALAGVGSGVVVNAAAYTAVDLGETEPAAAFAVNRDGAGVVAAAAAQCGLGLIHLSTDYVFDGASESDYGEDDPPSPLSVYGASKAAGECAVRSVHPHGLILRTAWLFGIHGRNFVRTILDLAQRREVLEVVDDQVGCPTFAGDLAAAILALAPRLLEGDGGGLFHCAGAEAVSWYGLAESVLAEAASRGVRVARLEPVATDAHPRPARRPARSVLCCDRLEAAHGLRLPSWRAALGGVVGRLLG